MVRIVDHLYCADHELVAIDVIVVVQGLDEGPTVLGDTDRLGSCDRRIIDRPKGECDGGFATQAVLLTDAILQDLGPVEVRIGHER